MPTDVTLAEYYGRYYESSAFQASETHVTFDEPRRLGRALAGVFCRRDAKLRILDFGGGDGTISHLAAEELVRSGMGEIEITVVECGTNLVAPRDSRIAIAGLDSLDHITPPYGLVVASAVIEHYPRPRALMQKLLEAVGDAGIFYARTPYMLPIMRLLRRVGIAMDFSYPGHVHDLGQAFWEAYFDREHPGAFRLLESRPSIVETTLRKHFFRTVAAYSLKAPWYVLGNRYGYVGGWEILAQRCARGQDPQPKASR